MVRISQEELETRLKGAGGAQGLVQKVMAALENANEQLYDDTRIERLTPDLDVLIQIMEEIAASMQSESDLDQKQNDNAMLAIGHCNEKMEALEQHIAVVKAEVARGRTTAAGDRSKLAELQAALDENEQKIAELQEHKKSAITWGWVPGYNWYLIGRLLDDLIENKESTLSDRVRGAEAELESVEKHLRASTAEVDVLEREVRLMGCKIHTLEQSKKELERRIKIYSARIPTVSDCIQYYRLLSVAIEGVEENLDLPNVVGKLNEIRQVQLSTGEVRQDTLRGELIHLGEDYDRYREHKGLVERVSISFKLFRIDEQLPRNYRLATVEEVNNHREASLQAMPSWEIAKLADGSAEGRLYKGPARYQIRNKVGHKLAVQAESDITFKLFGNQELPLNYRLATVQEVNDHRDAALEHLPMTPWAWGFGVLGTTLTDTHSEEIAVNLTDGSAIKSLDAPNGWRADARQCGPNGCEVRDDTPYKLAIRTS